MKHLLLIILVGTASVCTFADEQTQVNQISKIVQLRANCVGVISKIDFWKNDQLIQTNLLDSSYECESAASDLELHMNEKLGLFSAASSEYSRPSVYGIK